jgi:hypothetical protein
MSVFGKSENTKEMLSISGQGYATGKESMVSGAPGKGPDAKKPSL